MYGVRPKQYRSTIRCATPATCLGLAGLLGLAACAGPFEGRIEDPEADHAAAAGGNTLASALGSWDAGSSREVLNVMGNVGDPATLDFDGDGLSNAYESAHGSDPSLTDTDHDTVDDLAEAVAGTNPNDPAANPMTRGDFYFLSPFGETPKPERETLLFATALRSADLFILVDTTGSMQPVLSVLQQRLATHVVPEAARSIADLRVGVGAFQDFPSAPYGDPGDVAFAITQTPTSDSQLAQAGVNALKLGSGGDGPEAAIPALYALATGDGLGTLIPQAPRCENDGLGYACFRTGAVPIVLLVSDAEFHDGPHAEHPYLNLDPLPADYAATVAALRGIHARVISIHVASELAAGALDGSAAALAAPPPDAQAAQMRALSLDTGAVDGSGQALFFGVDASAAGLDARVVDAVRAVAEQVPISVSARLRDDPSDEVDATQLIARIEAHTSGGPGNAMQPGQNCATGLATRDRNADGVADTFDGVRPGTPLCFDVVPNKNTHLQQADQPKLYRAFIDVVADDSTTLDTRSVFLLVPPRAPVLL
jgi:hypothetical protein